MSLPETIKIIVFDAYGTLFNVRSIEDGLQSHFGDRAERISSIWRQKQLEYTWLRTLMNKYEPFSEVTKEALEFACKHENVTLSSEIRNDLLNRYFELSVFEEVPDLLKKLSNKYRLAILSNANLLMLKRAVAFNGLDSYLEAVLSADSVALFKPRPEVYEIATRHFDLEKGEITFVSSNTWDVAGAAAYGFYTIRLKRGEKPMDTMGFESSLEIDHLSLLI